MSDCPFNLQPDRLLSNDTQDIAATGADAGKYGPPPYLAGAASLARGGLSGWQRKKVADFIEAHVGEALPLALLARLANLSRYHFARSFKRSFGLPPHRYHVSRRIARAEAMLTERGRSVTEIARALGFAETSSFSTAFRKATGISPSHYRRRAG